MAPKQKFLDLVANAGRFAAFITQLVKFAEKHGLTDEEFGKIATDAGEPLVEQFILSLKSKQVEQKVQPPKPVEWKAPERLPTIRNRTKITVDRVTPLEQQFAALATEGKISDDWWREFNSKNYPSDTSRPTEILLGECDMGHMIDRGENVRDVVVDVKGVVRHGDSYEFVAWLRDMPKAGLEYWLAALDMLGQHPSGRRCAPYTGPSCGGRYVYGYWTEYGWHGYWFFLVVCEE